MKRKILSFIYDGRKFLSLHNKPHKDHNMPGWFVVTGNVKSYESYKKAVKRELKEETGLDAKFILNINWGSKYNKKNSTYVERYFVSFVDNLPIKLNEEHSKFQWLSLDDFLSKINWLNDKTLLKKVLKKAINKEVYFPKREIINYT